MTRRELAERVLAGDVHAAHELARLVLGTRAGRPRASLDVDRARELLRLGHSRNEVAAALHVSRRTLDRRLGPEGRG